jgi:hypothetical protein
MERDFVFRLLDEEFMGRGSQRGWRFIEMERSGDYRLYEKVDGESGRVYWEVVRIRVTKGGTVMIAGVEVEFEPKEVYPSDEKFGTDGWCYSRYDDALNKFSELVNVG